METSFWAGARSARRRSTSGDLGLDREVGISTPLCKTYVENREMACAAGVCVNRGDRAAAPVLRSCRRSKASPSRISPNIRIERSAFRFEFQVRYSWLPADHNASAHARIFLLDKSRRPTGFYKWRATQRHRLQRFLVSVLTRCTGGSSRTELWHLIFCLSAVSRFASGLKRS